MKLYSILNEIAESKKIKFIFTNFNDRSEDRVFKLTKIKLDRLVDIHDLLSFASKRIRDDVVSGALLAVSKAIKSGQPIADERFFDMHFAIDVKLGDSARGVSFIIKEDGTVSFKIRVDMQDQPGVINFDENFTEFKTFIKKSIE